MGTWGSRDESGFGGWVGWERGGFSTSGKWYGNGDEWMKERKKKGKKAGTDDGDTF